MENEDECLEAKDLPKMEKDGQIQTHNVVIVLLKNLALQFIRHQTSP